MSIFANGSRTIKRCEEVNFLYFYFHCSIWRQSESFIKMTLNIYDVIFPVHFVMKFSGYTMFSIDPVYFTAKFKSIDRFCHFLMICISICINHVFWKSFCGYGIMKRHKSEILKRSIPVLVYSSYVVYVLCMIWSTVCKRKIGNIIKKLCEIDEQVKKKIYAKYVSCFLLWCWWI